jgi:hypothetical protein
MRKISADEHPPSAVVVNSGAPGAVHRREVRADMSGVFLVMTLALTVLASCSHPLRLDPQRQYQQELQQRQQECLERGGNPRDCRP